MVQTGPTPCQFDKLNCELFISSLEFEIRKDIRPQFSAIYKYARLRKQ